MYAFTALYFIVGDVFAKSHTCWYVLFIVWFVSRCFLSSFLNYFLAYWLFKTVFYLHVLVDFPTFPSTINLNFIALWQEKVPLYDLSLLEGLGAGEGDNRGWDGWMVSPTRWTWVWVNSGSWWWTGRPGMLQFMGSQRVGHDWATELNWTDSRLIFWPNIWSILENVPRAVVKSMESVSARSHGALAAWFLGVTSHCRAQVLGRSAIFVH